MQQQNPCRKLIIHKPESTGRVGWLAISWLNPVEEDLKTTGVRNWRRKSQDRVVRRAVRKGSLQDASPVKEEEEEEETCYLVKSTGCKAKQYALFSILILIPL
jgi:hypothetical protein